MEALLTATDLHKSYILPHKTVSVLRGASFTVGAGERVAIVGRSGTGKSTLLHLLGGLDRPQAGEVRINGASLYALTPRARSVLRARQIGFVFQSYHLLPEMDVVENVMLPAMAIGENHARARARVLELLGHVGLSDRATHTPLELSGGEQQRVALARALMNAPRILLADEPTGNLDRDTGAQILELLFGLAQQHRHALVVVTHAPEVAARCDRVLRLENGLLLPGQA
jgi:predicted ABC-type transport system involved in lysophospholipase L1 biosynthesis ATPase subunit